MVTIYTDGACSGNPGKGGWAAILMQGNIVKHISGAEEETTNNRMELLSVINALSLLKYQCDVTIYSDSAYVVNAFNQGWIENWVENNWRTSGRKAVQNKDLWLRLLTLTRRHNVEFIKVKGHSDNQYNNECDRLARKAIYNLSQESI